MHNLCTVSQCKNRVLTRITGPKRQTAVGGWRRLHNEKLCNSYASPILLQWWNQGWWDDRAYKILVW